MKPRRGPRQATPEYLRNATLFYLERYASSVANLRRLLMAKVARSATAHGTDPAAGAAAVEALLAELVRGGLLDDGRYAEGRALALSRRGASMRAIRGRLASKGVAAAHIDRAVAQLRDETAEPDMAAALTFARRRRLGPYRSAAIRVEHRDRDLAALGRQGFSYDVARRVIEEEDAAALEDEIGDR